MRKNSCSHRVGFGFDSHRFSKGGRLMLGGILFPSYPSLQGHSDGDVLLHAVIDALLGAAALGDIGEVFPDLSARTKGISSVVMLKNVLMKIRRRNMVPVHIDVTILADQPKLSSTKKKIRSRIAGLVNLSVNAISVKAKTQEGLTLFSPPGGIAVWALATVI